MYDNIGYKIKNLAMAIAFFISLFSLGIGLFYCFQISILKGLLIIIISPIFAWIGSFILYGFGHLIENTDKLVEGKNKTQQNDDNKKEELINFSEEKLSQIKQQNTKWLNEIKSLSNEQLKERINATTVWQPEYIALCIDELKSRDLT